MGEMVKLEPKRRKPVNQAGINGRHDRRLTMLETRMATVEGVAATAAQKATEAADNSAEILAIVNATKGAAAFARKHGPRIVAFVTGLMASAGLGNPQVLAFLQSFFG